jgi:hypothetical protein
MYVIPLKHPYPARKTAGSGLNPTHGADIRLILLHHRPVREGFAPQSNNWEKIENSSLHATAPRPAPPFDFCQPATPEFALANCGLESVLILHTLSNTQNDTAALSRG